MTPSQIAVTIYCSTLECRSRGLTLKPEEAGIFYRAKQVLMESLGVTHQDIIDGSVTVEDEDYPSDYGD